MCKFMSRYIVKTIHGTLYVCDNCVTNHPIPPQFCKGPYREHSLSERMPCQCENIRHTFKGQS